MVRIAIFHYRSIQRRIRNLNVIEPTCIELTFIICSLQLRSRKAQTTYPKLFTLWLLPQMPLRQRDTVCLLPGLTKIVIWYAMMRLSRHPDHAVYIAAELEGKAVLLWYLATEERKSGGTFPVVAPSSFAIRSSSSHNVISVKLMVGLNNAVLPRSDIDISCIFHFPSFFTLPSFPLLLDVVKPLLHPAPTNPRLWQKYYPPMLITISPCLLPSTHADC